MRAAGRRRFREPTIALINIVFLMLVFFMVAGTLAQPLDRSLRLVRTQDLDGRAPPDTLVIHPDGRLSFRGNDVATPETYLATLDETDRAEIRIVPDRDLPAGQLVAIARALQAAGAGRILVVTERGLE
ncbi:ExbD/TolR family protein [Pukyongiella litopenaei]|uniref:Biopolymer transporter ExbD n=1 Tax=Pukyongiella litopenaei TaxID=2605946 RepID=A0A2S0MNI1_9RHOB|nr:biopolymer transporter ExbD [Pukyongiella litopenaei]AVO37434.1 biopolymer transporter ExbD [Pukyongiella litopenaei]